MKTRNHYEQLEKIKAMVVKLKESHEIKQHKETYK